MTNRFLATLLIGSGLLLTASSLLAQETDVALGDVAKAKVKTTTPKAKKVFTDEDFPSTSAPSREPGKATTASTSGPADAKDAGSDSAKTDAPAGTNASAGGAGERVAELQKQLDAVNHDEELLQKKLSELQRKADDSADPFRKKMYQDSIDNQQTTLSDFRKKRQDLEQQITDEKNKAKS